MVLGTEAKFFGVTLEALLAARDVIDGQHLFLTVGGGSQHDKKGILPGGSGTVRLSRLLGRGRAMEVVLGCDDVSAELAEAWGWVNRALPADQLWPHVDRLAARIASFPAHAVAAAKACVLRADMGVVDDLHAEAAAFQATLGGEGTHAAMRRFLATGGQTPAGELRLGELAGDLHAAPPGTTPGAPAGADHPAG